MKVTRSLLASSLRKALEYFGFLRVVEMVFDLAARLALAARASGRAERSARRGSRAASAPCRVTASTIALPQSLMVGTGLATTNMPSDEPPMMIEFERLHQHLEMAAERRIAAKDAADGDDQTDDETHVALLPPLQRRQVALPSLREAGPRKPASRKSGWHGAKAARSRRARAASSGRSTGQPAD